MNISEFAVNNYQFTIVIFLMTAALGVMTILTMPRSEDPELKSAHFPIVVIYPGTSPIDMEQLVVDPIEKRMSTFENISSIKSTINDGLAIIRVEYKHGVNVDEKYQEVIREVNNLRIHATARHLSDRGSEDFSVECECAASSFGVRKRWNAETERQKRKFEGCPE